MTTDLNAQKWIERAWSEMGRDFDTNQIPVARFHALEVDDLSFPFKNTPLESWFLLEGKLVRDSNAKIIRVPYIAFSVNEEANSMNIQVNWASRCGYGFEVFFDELGKVQSQKIRWIS